LGQLLYFDSRVVATVGPRLPADEVGKLERLLW
jgi:hypothetical protein